MARRRAKIFDAKSIRTQEESSLDFSPDVRERAQSTEKAAPASRYLIVADKDPAVRAARNKRLRAARMSREDFSARFLKDDSTIDVQKLASPLDESARIAKAAGIDGYYEELEEKTKRATMRDAKGNDFNRGVTHSGGGNLGEYIAELGDQTYC